MTKRYKIIKTISIVLASIILFIGSYFLFFSSFERYEYTEMNKAWMSNIKDDAPLNKIAIPGTHDSGTNGMIFFGECQHLSVEEQLNVGTRYFDLRVRKKDDKYLMYHSFINGVEFDPIMDAIENFLKDFPSETLILDFQHNDGAIEYIFSKVNALYNKGLVIEKTSEYSGLSDLEFISQLKLSDVRGKAIVFFGGNDSYSSEFNYIFKRNNDECTKEGCSLDSCYYTERNTKSSKKYISDSLPYYISRIEDKIDKEHNKGLFILQGQLTDGLLIFGPYSRERSHTRNMTEYINDLSESSKLDLINIILRDFITEIKCSEIIDLNKAKGYYIETE